MTKLALVRHGSTAWNKEKRAQGTADIPLDEDGKSDAAKLAERLAGDVWDLIITSPQTRARQTAGIIADRLKMNVLEDDRLREVDGGQIEGTTEEERIEKWGKDWRSLELGIEKPSEVQKRANDFVEAVMDEHPEKKVIVVTHGGLIQHLLHVIRPPQEKVHMKNTSLTEVHLENGKWNCHRFNCTLHLE
ncbi:histidine phosphatase family protein [Halobacillus yeomjeoni]|uniref:Histidine phosphatase family protein n=1 Tax=Halobacillus yeomjeoni TaxID=311194 RepID=A0A931HWZ9_9BACI|nr:histidine phosphatase family protein [Halobacillus yeomjeoni]MBH0230978.1 histidine phosphatase family protein [Halobacillus yeomjeoni]